LRYLLLLYGDPAAEAAAGADARAAMVEDHRRYGTMLRERGAMVIGEALEGPQETRTLRFDGDGVAPPIVTDGPFLEAKEVLGGLYVLECMSPDEALELAKQVPRSPGLVAELSPIAGT
jgi:hypothetical protein